MCTKASSGLQVSGQKQVQKSHNNGVKFSVGDIVDWHIYGPGGPAWHVGVLRCEVTHNYKDLELCVKPLDWHHAMYLLGKEGGGEYEDWKDILDNHDGVIECIPPEDCTLIKSKLHTYVGFMY